jgi:hypothetical protein
LPQIWQFNSDSALSSFAGAAVHYRGILEIDHSRSSNLGDPAICFRFWMTLFNIPREKAFVFGHASPVSQPALLMSRAAFALIMTGGLAVTTLALTQANAQMPSANDKPFAYEVVSIKKHRPDSGGSESRS